MNGKLFRAGAGQGIRHTRSFVLMRLKEPKRTNEKVYFFGQGDKEVGDVKLEEYGAAFCSTGTDENV